MSLFTERLDRTSFEQQRLVIGQMQFVELRDAEPGRWVLPGSGNRYVRVAGFGQRYAEVLETATTEQLEEYARRRRLPHRIITVQVLRRHMGG